MVLDAATIPHDAAPSFTHAAAMLHDAKRVVALTGAGISVESGIPPFRAPTQAEAEASGSIWGKFDAAKMTVQGFNRDAEIAKYWWALKHALLPKFSAAAPNRQTIIPPTYLFFCITCFHVSQKPLPHEV